MSTPNVEDIYGLSPMQFGMLFHSIRDDHGFNPYQVQMIEKIVGPLDDERFLDAWQHVVDRHSILRSAFVWQDVSTPVQVVQRTAVLPRETLDWRDCGPAEQDARLKRLADDDWNQGFDLSRPPLLRVRVIRTADECRLVMWSFHHILLDGWSIQLLKQELFAIYRAAIEGREPGLPPAIPYVRYAKWLHEQPSSRAREFWRGYLRGVSEPTELVASRPGTESGVAELEVSLSAELSSEVRRFAREQRITVNTVIQGVWSALLSRYSGHDDVLFGATTSGRSVSLAGIESMVGLFINTLPVRARVDGQATVGDWLRELQEQQIELRQWEHCHLVDVQECSDVPRGKPLFQSILVFENYPDLRGSDSLPDGVDYRPVDCVERTGYPLTVVVSADEVVDVKFAYDRALFDEETIERLAGHFQALVTGFVSAPRSPLSQISMLTEAEQRRMLIEWNDTAGPFPADQTIHQLVAAQATTRPDEPAVIHGDQILTHAQLNTRANQLAHHLRTQGIGPEDLVGVFLDRTPDLIIALLAILKAGAAYLPLDPEYPADRLTFMLDDTAAPLVITQHSLATHLPGHTTRLLIDTHWPQIATHPATDPPPLATPHNLAYVIYTSGSTGKPKGVMIEHQGAVNYLHWCAQAYPPTAELGTLLYSPVAFDLTVTALFLPLMQGLPIAIPVPQPGESAFAAATELLLSGTPVSFLKMTPSHAELLVSTAEAAGARLAVRTMVLGGEELTTDLARRILAVCEPGTVIYNEYGATECSVANVMSLTRQVDDDNTAAAIPVGVPITNTQAYVVDPGGRPVPVGVAGECLLGGICVARGYLNRPQLTEERFVELDLGGHRQRLYRTGDLCRWLPTGELEFLGRIDNQVKLRGYRIELGEIEATLIGHPAVASAAVTVREDTPGVQRLIAYLVPAPGVTPPSPHDLKAHAARTLPPYMIPTGFMTLPALPLTPNGKTDYKALPAPATIHDPTGTRPRTPTEHLIAGIWQDVLGAADPGIHDNFFDLGGHSLLAFKVIARLRRELDVEVPLRALFQAPTIAELGALLPGMRAAVQEESRPVPRDRSKPVPLSSAQRGLWFLDQLEPGRSDYVVPIALHLTGPVDVTALEQALTHLVARHEALRTRFAADDTGQPYQIIDPPAPVTITLTDLTGHDQNTITGHVNAAAATPFDLATGPLLRTTLLRTTPDQSILVICLHHIIFDGWSEAILARELRDLYTAATTHTPTTLPAPPIQYADYATWQHQQLTTDRLGTQLDYWRTQLADLQPLHLPTDRPRRPTTKHHGDAITFTIPPDTLTTLRHVTTQARASLFMALTATFQIMLSRYTGQNDIAIGTPTAGRTHTETENLIGLFVNSLVLRTDLTGDPTFTDLLHQVKNTALAAYDHQDLPFERIVEELAPQRDLTRNPLFQTMLVLQTTTETQTWNLPGIEVHPAPITGGLAKFDLNLTLYEVDDGLTAHIDYPTDLYDKTTIERMAGHYGTLLQRLADHPTTPLSQISMLTDAEHDALAAWGATAAIPAEVRDVPAAPAVVRVVDRHDRPVPVGVPGRLVLGGEHPYRTGDRVSWSPSGELRFLGRWEDQVIVRGDRVALGEIETALAGHDAVADAAAVVHDGELVGYVVPASPAPPEARELRQFLSERLPAFMVPSAYVVVPRLPRTADGAVDRQALPAPDARPAPAPHSAAEKVIAGIWREVLGVAHVSVTDNFFTLGGDSIISLQVIARAKKFGIQLTPRMFFQHQTVAAIAANAQSTSPILADQAKIVGEVPLTPIQHWFFELKLPDPAHFNQVELLETDGLDGAVLRRALLTLVDHHDALRLRIRKDGDRWRQYLDDDAGPGVLACHDLSALDDDGVWPRMARIADEAQRGMDLDGGPVIRAALMELGPGRGQRLLIAIHHLAVDGVSWRILLEDLGTAYRQAAEGRDPLLPAKTTSVRTWGEKLGTYARSAGALAELGYWTAQGTRRTLPRDHDGANTMRSSAAVTVALSESETDSLLRDVPRAFHTQINDALLSAVGAAVHAWTGDDAACVSLEGHGREDLFPDVDTSRTVGWFTSVFPIALHGMSETDPAILLKNVSEQLGEIPRRGVGYGILRYLGDARTREALAHPSPEINFNYLGQFAAGVTGLGRYADPREPRGRSIGAAGMRRHLLDILAAVENGRLSIEISYSTAIHDVTTVERFAENIVHNLRALLGIAAEQSEGIGAAPAHLPLAELDEDEMAAIMRKFSA